MWSMIPFFSFFLFLSFSYFDNLDSVLASDDIDELNEDRTLTTFKSVVNGSSKDLAYNVPVLPLPPLL